MIEQLEVPAPPGRGRYPITKLECPLVERESVGVVASEGSRAPGGPGEARITRTRESETDGNA